MGSVWWLWGGDEAEAGRLQGQGVHLRQGRQGFEGLLSASGQQRPLSVGVLTPGLWAMTPVGVRPAPQRSWLGRRRDASHPS